ncbi:DUF6934 family protein [Dyadobacter aurulentus]|uniref:DUF6934 family protein n=1 Tax=Dyadobacter sp. UC 10 TaxID=2605428 RepID=UPI0038D5138C
MFFHEGLKDVPKVVEYSYIQLFEDREVYNLGFGDYCPELKEVRDQVKSNNGDSYKVFRTVLSTVPIFFERQQHAILMVQGSDGGAYLIENCRKSCTKRCVGSCKKSNQRITVYRNFVEKNFLELSIDYWFLGGFLSTEIHTKIERYIPGHKYDTILLFKK